VSALVDLTARSSIVLLAGFALTALLAGRSAALRHWVLAAAIVAAAAVSPLSLIMPEWAVALPGWQAAAPAALPPVVPTARAASPDAAQIDAGAAVPRASDRPVIAVVWAAGFAVAAAILLTGVIRLARVDSRAPRVEDGPWVSITRTVAAAYHLRREVILLQTDTPNLLATWGVHRPRVLLPSHASEWSEDRIHAVLCHELAHIRRHDWIVQISAQALLTLFWFNPLMWVACRRLRRESEQACDDSVLACGVSAREYAGHLLDLARQCRRPQLSWAAATPMAQPSTLERRITAMLNPRLDRTALSFRAIILTAAGLLAVTLPAAALRAAQATPAALAGSVYDATGAVLPGVAVTLEDAQQVTWQATTSATGRFEFPLIGAGRYVITAALPGFRELRQEFDLRAPRDWDRAVTLQVGDLQETVTVSERRMPRAAAPSQPQAAQRVRVGGNIRTPRKEYDVNPVYPPAMRDAGREGTVRLDAAIGRDGTVTAVRVLSAQVHPDFAIAAVDAVRQWRFRPTLLNGSPVEVAMTVSVRFSLSN
jgi:TonB family protein